VVWRVCAGQLLLDNGLDFCDDQLWGVPLLITGIELAGLFQKAASVYECESVRCLVLLLLPAACSLQGVCKTSCSVAGTGGAQEYKAQVPVTAVCKK
jgi:hypothetical protein